MNFLRKKLTQKVIAYTLIGIFVPSLITIPIEAEANGNGTKQAEHEGGASSLTIDKMVDPATGNFSYSIPLLDVEGYPLTLSYAAGIGMEQEASWVGLGWTLSPGVLNRSVRGLPDDFKGDEVKREANFKTQKTNNLHASVNLEFVGYNFTDNGSGSSSAGIRMGANSGTGVGVTWGQHLGTHVDFSQTFSSSVSDGLSGNNIGINMQGGSSGITLTPFLGGQIIGGKMTTLQESYGLPINSRDGIRQLSVSRSLNASQSIHYEDGIQIGNKKSMVSGGVGVSSYVPFGTISSIPYQPYAKNTSGFAYDIGIGGELSWSSIKGTVKHSKVQVEMENMNWSNQGYGYIYSQYADGHSLMDFNGETNGEFNSKTPRLGFSAMTPDVYTASAMGSNFNFRPHRNDVGQVADPIVQEGNSRLPGGFEIMFGQLIKAGVNLDLLTIKNTSGPWEELNGNLDDFKFLNGSEMETKTGKENIEPFYFRVIGEPTRFQNSIYASNTLGDESPIEPQMTKKLKKESMETYWVGNDPNTQTTLEGNYYRTERQPLNHVVQALTADEAKYYGLNRKIKRYTVNNFAFDVEGDGSKGEFLKNNPGYKGYTSVDRGSYTNGHHFHQFTALDVEGTRFIYDVPVYNLDQHEVTFSVDKDWNQQADRNWHRNGLATGLVSYSKNVDNSTQNARGISGNFDKKEMPAYATDYLLSGVVSSNYVDMTGDGLTPDDNGNYTRFNYAMLSNNFKWRNPIQEDMAYYNPNTYVHSSMQEEDDMASYVYGKKELWYLHSMESKNYVAEFHTSDRFDGLGVDDENGKISTSIRPQQLDKIVLYPRQEKIKAVNDPNYQPVPVKTVYFEYDYSLCPGTPNSLEDQNVNPNSGKLTLTGIYFTYGNQTERSKERKYIFHYGDPNHTVEDEDDNNPSYDPLAKDRWGSYLPQKELEYIGDSTNGYYFFSTNLTNQEFPYSVQNKLEADKNASAWNLTSIELPNESKIEIDYESDSYGRVMYKKATRMYKIKGFAHHFQDLPTEELYNDTPNELVNHLYMVIDLGPDAIDGGLSKAQADQILRAQIIGDLEEVYFKVFAGLKAYSDDTWFDFVAGYAGIDKSESQMSKTGTEWDRVYIKLIPKGLKKDKIAFHPVSKAVCQFARSMHSGKMFPAAITPGGQVNASLAKQMFHDAISMHKGVDHVLMKRGVGKYIFPQRSWVRLNCKNELKYGGGHRVKEIRMIDNWDKMAVGENSKSNTYGLSYTYEDETNHKSYGVANWEPIIGGDENPFREPLHYENKRVWANNDALFGNWPFGEFMCPSPVIVYEKVIQKPLEISGEVEKRIGYTEYEYYTAKDGGTTFKAGEIKREEHRPHPLFQIFNIRNNYELRASQGFVLKLSDLHGKPKKVSHYRFKSNNDQEIYQYTNYKYSVGQKLDEVDESGKLYSNSGFHGREVDMTVYSKEQRSETRTASIKVNLDASFTPTTPPVLLPIFSLYGMYNEDKKTFRSATFNKVIQDYAQLEQVESYKEGYLQTVDNSYLDQRSGQVRITESVGKFQNDVWSSSDPAHLRYPEMGYAYENIGATINEDYPNEHFTNDGLIDQNASQYFFPGDEVYLYNLDDKLYDPEPYWVVEALNDLNQGAPDCSTYVFMDRHGDLATLASGKRHSAKIIRSGRRNLLTAKIGQITALGSVPDPISPTAINPAISQTALSVSAQKFGQDWKVYGARKNITGEGDDCAFQYDEKCSAVKTDATYNPYVKGSKGNWRPTESFVYYAGRNQNKKENDNQDFLDLKYHGTFVAFPFWTWNGSQLVQADYSAQTGGIPVWSDSEPRPWVSMGQIQEYGPNGNPMESQDPKGIASAAHMGYNQSIPKSQVANSKYLHAAYDGFEDYDYQFSNPGSVSNSTAPNLPACMDQHFKFPITNDGYVSGNSSHTGRYSYLIEEGKSVTLKSRVDDQLEPVDQDASNLKRMLDGTCSTFSANHVLDDKELIPPFSYKPNEPYRISFWVKVGDEPYSLTSDKPIISYEDDVEVTLLGCDPSDGQYTAEIDYSPIIDGWQKWDLTFTTPAANAKINIELVFKNKNTSKDMFIDDIRLHPLQAQMESYVIDPVNLRSRAVLDVNNFATFFEYDDEGVQTIVKKETERGIFTITETRHSTFK
ncbi:hypothetical protein KFE98_19660 [bacterium SCSIO 12741]|nr:hypothetical protein KFE98_19660 [bacterium SCSIO 12741]